LIAGCDIESGVIHAPAEGRLSHSLKSDATRSQLVNPNQRSMGRLMALDGSNEMTENPAHFALRMLLQTFPFWLPIGLLLFGFAKVRRLVLRLIFLSFAAMVVFALFYGPVMLGRDVNGNAVVSGLGALVGVSLGFAFRRRATLPG
jgi:hypothetical protein